VIIVSISKSDASNGLVLKGKGFETAMKGGNVIKAGSVEPNQSIRSIRIIHDKSKGSYAVPVYLASM
jgi:hypothetical protein